MKLRSSLFFVALSALLPSLAHAAITLQIDGVPIDQLESKGLGLVSSHTTKAGTRRLRIGRDLQQPDRSSPCGAVIETCKTHVGPRELAPMYPHRCAWRVE